LTIFNELKADEEATNKVSQISISASAVIYLAIGIFGYFTFGEGIKPNILRGCTLVIVCIFNGVVIDVLTPSSADPSTDIAVTIARVAISLHVLYSYRLQVRSLFRILLIYCSMCDDLGMVLDAPESEVGAEYR